MLCRDHLLAHQPGLDPPTCAPLSLLSQAGMVGVLAHDETGACVLQAPQHRAGAVVPVGDPQLPRPCAFQQRRHPGALARVRVLAGHQVHHQATIRVVCHQRVPRQRRTAQGAQGQQALLAARQVVAVQHPHLPAGQAGRRAQLRHHRRQPLGAAANEGTQHAGFGVVDLVIQGRQRHRQRRHLARCRVQGRAQAQRHQRGQLDHGREQQLTRILPLPMRLEHLVHPARRQRVLQRQARHHARRRVPLKPLQNQRPHRTNRNRTLAHPLKLERRRTP